MSTKLRGQRLCDEHSIERIAVQTRQRSGSRGILYGDWQLAEALVGDDSRYIRATVSAVGSLPMRCLVAISQPTPR